MDWQSPSSDLSTDSLRYRKTSALRRALGMAGAHGNIVISSVLFGIAVTLLGIALDYFLIHQERLRYLSASLIVNVAFGVVAAILVNRLLAHEREKHERVLERLAIIDEMNHHIRNALQVIAFSALSASNAPEVNEITRAVDRIQWSLREILPRVEPEFTPFEGSARKDAESVRSREELRKSGN